MPPTDKPVDRSRPVMFITGGSRGLGRELVRHFAPRFNVAFGWHKSEENARSLADELASAGHSVLPVRLDVSRADSLMEAASQTKAWAGNCNVLLHTTGVFSMKSLAEMDVETWDLEIQTTVNAGFYAWQAFREQLRSHDRSRVIFVGDSAADQLRARRQSTAYYVGKHGLLLLARTIAADNQNSGLTCNMVSPGVLPNSIDLDQPGMKPNVTFSEIAGIIDFLLSPAADSISGTNMMASRGWNL